MRRVQPVTPADFAAVEAGCYFDLAEAERVRVFFRRFLRHSKGQFSGKPFELLPWQWEDLVKPLFGWRRADGSRRFRRAYVQIPKKNGKSTICAGIALYLLLGDGEPGAEIYTAAASRAQASVVFDEIASMVRASDAIARRLKVQHSYKKAVTHDRAAWVRALAADGPRNDGLNIHGLIFDELHTQPNRILWDALKYGGASRRQPLYISITTAGTDLESICYDQYGKAKSVLNGTDTDWSFFPLVYEAGADDDWKDPATWRKANPSFGYTLNEESFAEDFADALKSPVNERKFKQLRLNKWQEGSSARWITLEKWDACRAEIDWAALRGKPCYAGLDLACTTDLAAASLWFPESRVVLPAFWAPEEAAQVRERENLTRFEKWFAEKKIETVPGAVLEYDYILKWFNDRAKEYKIKEVHIDRWNHTGIAQDLKADGFKVFGFGQGFGSMSGPSKEFERLVLSGKLQHDGHPVLRWCVGNTVVDMNPAGDIKPNKDRSPEKIDGTVSTVEALGGYLLSEKKRGSVYDRRDVTTI